VRYTPCSCTFSSLFFPGCEESSPFAQKSWISSSSKIAEKFRHIGDFRNGVWKSHEKIWPLRTVRPPPLNVTTVCYNVENWTNPQKMPESKEHDCIDPTLLSKDLIRHVKRRFGNQSW
jgi:hypothetical protein